MAHLMCMYYVFSMSIFAEDMCKIVFILQNLLWTTKQIY